jgi:phosphate/sulfate permease
MVMSFAHGSNDIANAMGPFSAVYYIWVNQAVPTKSPVSATIAKAFKDGQPHWQNYVLGYMSCTVGVCQK